MTTLRSRALHSAFPLRAALALVALGPLVAACDTASDRGASLYTPDETIGARLPDPTFTSVTPKTGEALIGGKAVAGITQLVLKGANFVPGKTSVFFNGKPVQVVSMTTTEIVVVAPNMPMDNVAVKVMVQGAVNFSPVQTIALASAIVRWGALGQANGARGVATDYGANTGYAYVLEGNGQLGFQRVVDGTRTTVVTPPAGADWPELAYQGGFLYGVYGVPGIARFQVPGGTRQIWAQVSTDLGVQITAFDLEADGGIWAGGRHNIAASTNRRLYYISPAKAVTNFPHGGEITAVEATASKIFVAGTVAGEVGVWTYARTGNTVGAPTLLAAFPSTVVVNALAATADGGVLAGVAPTDVNLNATFADPLRHVSASGAVTTRLPGLLNKGIVAMRWLDAERLLVSGAAMVGNDESQKPARGDLLTVAPLVSAMP